jgi:hypothetical protein
MQTTAKSQSDIALVNQKAVAFAVAFWFRRCGHTACRWLRLTTPGAYDLSRQFWTPLGVVLSMRRPRLSRAARNTYPTGNAWRRPGRPGRPMLQRFASVSRRGADLIRKRSICHTIFRLNTDDKPMDFLLFSSALSVYPLRLAPIVRLPRKSPGLTGSRYPASSRSGQHSPPRWA